jgi:hypothetical protein
MSDKNECYFYCTSEDTRGYVASAENLPANSTYITIYTQLCSGAVKHIAKLPLVQEIRINKPSGKSFKDFRRFTIEEDGGIDLSPLSSMAGLKEIEIKYACSPAAIATLQSSTLKVLTLNVDKLTSQDLQGFGKRFPALEVLTLTDVFPDNIDSLQNFYEEAPPLLSFAMEGGITTQHIQGIQNIASLKQLKLENAFLSDEMLMMISQVSTLDDLHIEAGYYCNRRISSGYEDAEVISRRHLSSAGFDVLGSNTVLRYLCLYFITLPKDINWKQCFAHLECMELFTCNAQEPLLKEIAALIPHCNILAFEDDEAGDLYFRHSPLKNPPPYSHFILES